MGGEVYAVTSGKGGVGKTTTAVSLAVALRQRGRSVVVVDADLGMPNVAPTLDVEPDATLHDLLADERGGSGVPEETGGDDDAAGSGPDEGAAAAAVVDAVVELADGFGILAGDHTLEGYAAAEPTGLETVVDALAARYACVLLDTGGGLSYEGVLPLELCDELLLVTSPDPAAVGDTAKSKELAGRLDAPVRGVVVTRVTDGDDPEEIAGRLGVSLLGAVPFDSAVTESATAGEPLATHAPESDAAKAYDRIATTLAADLQETPDPLDGGTSNAGGGDVDDAGAGSSDQSPDPALILDGESGREPDADGRPADGSTVAADGDGAVPDGDGETAASGGGVLSRISGLLR